jgi:hypothetical protein
MTQPSRTVISERERNAVRSHHYVSRFPQGDYACLACESGDPAAGWVGDEPRCRLVRFVDAIETAESDREDALRLLRDLYATFTLSSGPPGYLVREEQMAEVGRFLSTVDPGWQGVLPWHRGPGPGLPGSDARGQGCAGGP